MRKRAVGLIGSLAAAVLSLLPAGSASADRLVFPCNSPANGMSCQRISPAFREAKVAYTNAGATASMVMKASYDHVPYLGAGGRAIIEINTKNRYFGSWDYTTKVSKIICVDTLTVSKIGLGTVTLSGAPSVGFGPAADGTWTYTRRGTVDASGTSASCGLNGVLDMRAGGGTSITSAYWSTETRIEFVNGYSVVALAGNGGSLNSDPYYLPYYSE
ncbi:hypothetical protein ACFPM7_29510 [Actinokineospora guangxiensis]|uniref:Peptidase inhibitor family I36 n=1 Tax=Actinokineospora guangxiensis TaxID=1490288 RepID=A0ABW0EXZ2_9PSEU